MTPPVPRSSDPASISAATRLAGPILPIAGTSPAPESLPSSYAAGTGSSRTTGAGFRVPAIFQGGPRSQSGIDPEATRELAQAFAEGAREESSDIDAVRLYLASAQYFISLDLTEAAGEALQSAWERAKSLQPITECLQAFLQIAEGYQSAGRVEEANRAFAWIRFAGENSPDTQAQSLARLAQVFRHLNLGEFEAAEENLSRLPESEMTRAFASEIREGARRVRVLQNLQIFQSMIFLYSETHSFAAGIDRAQVRAGMLAALQSAAESAISGEQPNLYEGLLRSDYPWVESFLIDTLYGRRLQAISEPRIDASEHRFRWLRVTDHFMEDNDYAAVGLMADLMQDEPELAEHAAIYRSRIEYQVNQRELHRSGANLVGDWLGNTAAGLLDSGRNFLSFMTIGSLGGSIDENIPGTAEILLLIATEGFSLQMGSLFSAAQWTRRLHPLARQALGWGARSGTSALMYTSGGMALQAAETRSWERFTARQFAREFGANMVMFGLLHSTGMATRALAAPLRYAANVGGFVASDYLNEGLGLRDPLDLPIATRLLNAVTMDAKVRFAHWLGNRINAGGFDRLHQLIDERDAEHAREYRARSARQTGRSRSLGRLVYDANLILATLLLGGAVGSGGGEGGPPRRPGGERPESLEGYRQRIGELNHELAGFDRAISRNPDGRSAEDGEIVADSRLQGLDQERLTLRLDLWFRGAELAGRQILSIPQELRDFLGGRPHLDSRRLLESLDTLVQFNRAGRVNRILFPEIHRVPETISLPIQFQNESETLSGRLLAGAPIGGEARSYLLLRSVREGARLFLELAPAFGGHVIRGEVPLDAQDRVDRLQEGQLVGFIPEARSSDSGPQGGEGPSGSSPASGTSDPSTPRSSGPAGQFNLWPEALTVGLATFLAAAPAHASVGFPALDGPIGTAEAFALGGGIIYAGFRIFDRFRQWRAGRSGDSPPSSAETSLPRTVRIVLAPELSGTSSLGPYRTDSAALPRSEFDGTVLETFEDGRPRRIGIVASQMVQGEAWPAGSEFELNPNGSIRRATLGETDATASLGIDGRTLRFWPNGRLERAVYSASLAGEAMDPVRWMGVPEGSEVTWDSEGNIQRIRLSRPSEILGYPCEGEVLFYPDGQVSRFTLARDLWYNSGRTFRAGTTVALDEEGRASEWGR